MKSRLQLIASIPMVNSLRMAQVLLDEMRKLGLYVVRRDELAEGVVNMADRGVDLNDLDLRAVRGTAKD